MTTSRIRRAKILLALGVVGLALGAAAPVHAEPNQPPPKKGCLLEMPDRYESFNHGDTVTITGSDGSKSTFRCNDGKWERVQRVLGNPRTRVVIAATSVTLVRARP